MLKCKEVKIYEDLDKTTLKEKVLRKNRINPQDVRRFVIRKKSIDARDKNDVHYCYSCAVEVEDENKYPYLTKEAGHKREIIVNRTSDEPVVIVGAGPAGLFCALELIKYGARPIIIEQGECVEQRMKSVENYRNGSAINPSSNVQFGEGGAGTFSDGKLTTSVNSELIDEVLQSFVAFGAPEEVGYLNKPHIGTDNLVRILKNIRTYIESKGGEYRFNTTFIDYQADDSNIIVKTDQGDFKTDALVLAVGHSARKTFELLKQKNITMCRKNFAIGVRIEHLQSMINQSQYGTQTKLKLPPADYKLVYHDPINKRACYSFCMCPGGEVMASASEAESIVTNGMSYYNRDGKNANAALLVNIMPEDFKDDDDLLAGMKLQQSLEHEAYVLAGSNHNAPIQRVEDFENNVPSTQIGEVEPTYKPGVTLCNLNDLLPMVVSETLKRALPYFDRKIKGFNHPDAILTAVESRSSSPITIVRDDSYQCCQAMIYPCGEGAGYAGGITTAAIDGIKVADAILTKN